MVLNSRTGFVNLDGLDEFGGLFVNRSVDTINAYLATPTDGPLRIWQATWVPLLLGSFFLLVALIMLYAVVGAMLRPMRRQ